MSKLCIAEIKIGKRYRQDLGDLGPLAQSIQEIGLLHPIVVRDDGVLIAGHRRMAACELLGWQEIPATVLNLESIVKGEHDENVYHKSFTPSEAVAIAAALEPAEREAAKERQRTHSETGYGRIPCPAPALDRVASAVGMSRRTLVKARAIVNGGDAELVAEMDRTGNVNGPYREVKRRQDKAMLKAVIPPRGKYRTIVLDPPWDWDDEGDVSQMGRAKPTYAAMPIAEVAELPVADLADENCHLYLWITNRSLPKGFALIETWGFRYLTTLTWCKPSIGMGNYFRNSTEHILFAVKGSMRLLRFDMGTWFEAARGNGHSVKPDEAYEIIVSCSPEPRLDMFARKEREGFTTWGNL